MAWYLADDDQLPGEWVDGEWFLGVESSHRVGHPAVVAVVGVTGVHLTDHRPDKSVLARPELVPRRVEPINRSHTTGLRPSWISSGTIRVSRHQKSKTRKVNPI